MTPGRDPGLQPERTRLAWQRTALAAAVVAALLLREGIALTRADLTVLGAACLMLALALRSVGLRRAAGLAGPQAPVAPPRSVVGASAALTALLAVAFALHLLLA